MHASFLIGPNRIMASDGCKAGALGFKSFAHSVAPADEAEAKRVFDALGQDVLVTLLRPAHRQVRHRWMVNMPAEGCPSQRFIIQGGFLRP